MNMGLQLILKSTTKDEGMRKIVGDVFSKVLRIKPTLLKKLKR